MTSSISKWAKSTKAYKELKAQISKDKKFAIALQTSLMIAQQKAWKGMHPDLFDAINDVFGGNNQGWPTTTEDYLNYIERYLVLVPNEIDDPNYPDAWTSDSTNNGYNQKVYDLLCHFYFLVDQKIPSINGTLQDYKKGTFSFAKWLREFAIDWGKFLDTKESLTLETLASFIADPMYNLPLYDNAANSWNTFNEFFYREFNGADKKGHSPLRPIAEPANNNVITSPADCTFKKKYQIDKDGNVLDIDGNTANLKLKHTHSVTTVKDLLGDKNDDLAKQFYGGTFVHYFLSPFDYHRFHSPVNGTVKECKKVKGKVFLDVNLTDQGEFDAPDSSLGGYEFQQSRGVFVVDTGEKMGLIAAIPIGMAQVSGVDMYSKLKGKKVAKGDEFGKFMFGGSDIILLFQKNKDLYLWEKDPAHNPIHFQYGQVSAYWKVK